MGMDIRTATLKLHDGSEFTVDIITAESPGGDLLVGFTASPDCDPRNPDRYYIGVTASGFFSGRDDVLGLHPVTIDPNGVVVAHRGAVTRGTHTIEGALGLDAVA